MTEAELTQLRIKISGLRKSKTKKWIRESSSKVVDEFLSVWQHAFAKKSFDWSNCHVALYRAIPGEVSLAPLEKFLREHGAQLYFPRMEDVAKGRLEFVAMNRRAPWSIGPFGVQEPDRSLPIADPSIIDLLFIPGLVYDMKGIRLGMGRGFYDRLLPRCPRALRVALAFDFQLQPDLPQKEWDQPVHWIVTEAREVKTPEFEKVFPGLERFAFKKARSS